MLLSPSQKSALTASFFFLIWEMNLIFPEQKKYLTLLSILLLLALLVRLYHQHLRLTRQAYWDLFFNLKFWKVNLNYLLLPLFLLVSTAAFVKFLPNYAIQQMVLIISFVALHVIILNTSAIYQKQLKPSVDQLKVFTLSKFYTIFLAFASSYALFLDQRLSLFMTSVYIFSIAVIFFYLAARRHGFHDIIYHLLGSGLLSVAACYLTIYLGFHLLAGSFLITIAYYLSWGMLSQRYQRTALTEYSALAVLLFVLLWINHLGEIV